MNQIPNRIVNRIVASGQGLPPTMIAEPNENLLVFFWTIPIVGCNLVLESMAVLSTNVLSLRANKFGNVIVPALCCVPDLSILAAVFSQQFGFRWRQNFKIWKQPFESGLSGPEVAGCPDEFN